MVTIECEHTPNIIMFDVTCDFQIKKNCPPFSLSLSLMIVITHNHARATPHVHLRHMMINSSCTKITVPTNRLPNKKVAELFKKEKKYYCTVGLLFAPHWAFFTQTYCSKQVLAQNNMQSQRVVSKTLVLSAIHSPKKFHFCHSMNCSMCFL